LSVVNETMKGIRMLPPQQRLLNPTSNRDFPNAQSTHTTQTTPLYRITETHLEANMKNKKARKKYKSVRPLLSSPILDEEVPSPMENTSASRPTKTQARNAEPEKVEESASRKHPFEGLGLYMPEDVQPWVGSSEPKQQKYDAHGQNKAIYHAMGLATAEQMMIKPEPGIYWNAAEPSQFLPQIELNYPNHPYIMSHEQLQAARIQHTQSMKRSRVPEVHRNLLPSTMVPTQENRFNSESKIRREHQIARKSPVPPFPYKPPPSQSTAVTHTGLPSRPEVMSAAQRWNTNPGRNEGHRNTARDSQSIPPEIPEVAARTHQIRKERDSNRSGSDRSLWQTARQSPSIHQPTTADGTGSYFASPDIPSLSFLNIMYNYDDQDLEPYLKFLKSLQMHGYRADNKRHKITQLAQGHNSKLYNDWLLSLLPAGGKEIHKFRSIAQPEEYDYSLLARCTRFAQSRSERRFSWTVHPVHIALIMERTNDYGKAITNERDGKVDKAVDEDVTARNQKLRLLAGFRRVFAAVRPGEVLEEYLGAIKPPAMKE
jgi:hypothetical protein